MDDSTGHLPESLDESTSQAIYGACHDAICVADSQGRIVSVNPAFAAGCGQPVERLAGQPWWFNVIDSAGFSAGTVDEIRVALGNSGHWDGELWRRRVDGEAYLEVTRLVRVDGPNPRIVCIGAQLGSAKAQKLARWQLNHDALTKLPNRMEFRERLGDLASRRRGNEQSGAVMFVGLDRFKYINELLGHDGGDRVLVEAARRIALAARDGDTVARTGGDEFALIMPDVDNGAEVETVARRLLDDLTRPYQVDGREFVSSASIGIAVMPHDGHDPDELVRRADSALRRAKEGGRNQFLFFEQQMNARAARHLEIESHLRKALQRDELDLHYQPVVDLHTGRVATCEALLRWQHPEWGMVSPGEFIPVAEESGLIVPIGQWIVEQVARQLTLWGALGQSGFRVAVNISARQLSNEDRVTDLTRALAAADPRRLTVEITESLLMRETTLVQRFIDHVRAMGIKVALDDFGTGYSALGYLRRFEMDVLKIDKSFIDDIDSDLGDLSLVATIISMGRTMGLRVVAEGVETERQLNYLRSLGCDMVQGYLFSRPVPADQLPAVISAIDERQGQLATG